MPAPPLPPQPTVRRQTGGGGWKEMGGGSCLDSEFSCGGEGWGGHTSPADRHMVLWLIWDLNNPEDWQLGLGGGGEVGPGLQGEG